MTTQCPSCGDHYTTYEYDEQSVQSGATVAGYTTPIVEVDLPGELEVVGTHMETRLHILRQDDLQHTLVPASEYGWAIRQIVPNGQRYVVVLERPYGWADTDG